ncbi:hypothetical protein EBR25_06815 [bacterium]|nr:hypothetical protein [bacterium]
MTFITFSIFFFVPSLLLGGAIYFFTRKSVEYFRLDLLNFILPLALWNPSYWISDNLGVSKSLANLLVEWLILGCVVPLVFLVRAKFFSTVPSRKRAVVGLAVNCTVAVALAALVPGIPE